MRNKHPGYCYYCAKPVEARAGHFERTRPGSTAKWRLIHAECVFKQRAEKQKKQSEGR